MCERYIIWKYDIKSPCLHIIHLSYHFCFFVYTLVDDVFYYLRPKEGTTDSVDLRKAQNNPLQQLWQLKWPHTLRLLPCNVWLLNTMCDRIEEMIAKMAGETALIKGNWYWTQMVSLSICSFVLLSTLKFINDYCNDALKIFK